MFPAEVRRSLGFARNDSTRQAIENNTMPHLIAKARLELHSVDKDFLARGASSIAAHQFLIDRASY